MRLSSALNQARGLRERITALRARAAGNSPGGARCIREEVSIARRALRSAPRRTSTRAKPRAPTSGACRPEWLDSSGPSRAPTSRRRRTPWRGSSGGERTSRGGSRAGRTFWIPSSRRSTEPSRPPACRARSDATELLGRRPAASILGSRGDRSGLDPGAFPRADPWLRGGIAPVTEKPGVSSRLHKSWLRGKDLNLRPLGYENTRKVASGRKGSDKRRLDRAFESSIFASCSRQIARLSPDQEARGRHVRAALGSCRSGRS